MEHLVRMVRGRITRLLVACTLLTGGIGAPVLLMAGTADAAVCLGATPVAAGVACTDPGQLNFTAGTLTFTPPTSFTWTATSNGLDQMLLDANTADEVIVVDDARGGIAGWNVTASATVFTNGSATLPTSALKVNGSITSALATTVPAATCAATSTCTPPTTTVTFPQTILTTPVKIYNAPASSGEGIINIGTAGTIPMGWWVTVPGNQPAPGPYTSTITLTVATGP